MGLRIIRIAAVALAFCLTSQLVRAEAEAVFTENATCGTQTIWMQKMGKSTDAAAEACSNEGMCDIPINRDARIPDSTTPILYVRLVVHILRNDDGSNPISSDVNTQTIINNLNLDYLPSRIQFEPVVDYVNSSQWRTLSESEIFAMKQATAYKPDSFLNVWATTVDFGYSYGTFPFDPAAQTEQGGIVMGHFHWTTNSHVFAHEVGHCLGLYHTFNGVDEVTACGPCYEAVNSPDKDVRGDRCSDTDPGPTVTSCSMSGTDACSGLPWGPALSNLHSYMSYSSCTQFFTPQQMGRMQCWTDNALTSWVSNVRIAADTQIGPAPLTVHFQGLTAKSVNVWDWQFGDGGTGAVQQPTHVYTTPGAYDVSVTIQTGSGNFTTTKQTFVEAYADTIKPLNTSAGPGDSIFIQVYARNYIPLSDIKIPFTWAGPLAMDFADIRTTGLRSSGMGTQLLTSFSPGTQQAAFRLAKGNGTVLAPGSGPILTIVFVMSEEATGGPNPIAIQSYSVQDLHFIAANGSYVPVTQTGQVELELGICGDVNNNGAGPNVQDLNYIIAYVFNGGAPPPNPSLADVNHSGSLNVLDINFMVAYFFNGGAAPSCP